LVGSGDPLLVRAMVQVGPRLLAEIAWSVVSGGRRSVARDAQRVVALMDPPPKVSGLDHVPRREPFVLIANHFQAPGLWIGWVAATITASVAAVRDRNVSELHWVVTSEWLQLDPAERRVRDPITPLIFPRAARAWGLVSTPADPSEVAGRARALRKVLACLGRGHSTRSLDGDPVAIFPEGTATVGLCEARPGSGAFLHMVSSMGVPLLPVGVHEENGSLVVSFGEPFSLEAFPGDKQRDLDGWARKRVMAAIGRLLPRDLWGVYAEAIAQERV
jgi:1-acyl-sn-glycerol-3-phosphate acyltransferase